MAHRFTAWLLFAVLALAAYDSFERRAGTGKADPGEADGSVTAMDGGNGFPPGSPK